jgi:ATP-binding cassette subfamily B multidrug efflux pump
MTSLFEARGDDATRPIEGDKDATRPIERVDKDATRPIERVDKRAAETDSAPQDSAVPEEKATNPRGSLRRLLGLVRPYCGRIAAVLAFGIIGVAFNVLGPTLLGRATDLISAGYLGRQSPPGSTKDEVIRRLNAEGNHNLAQVLTTVDIVPGHGIDFGRLGQLLSIVLALYLASSLFLLVQGRITATVVQRVVFNLRENVTAKLGRLPLSYFDLHPRGELLSRVTNDVDNLQQILEQSLSQLVTSLFTLLGVLAVMLVMSPLLALIVLTSVPASALLAAWISKRAQPQYAKQWTATGTLNAQIEETYAGHSLVKTFGRHELAQRAFDEHNEALSGAAARAQFLSATIEPAMVFLANLGYILVAVVGALRVASGLLSIGDVQAFIQYSAQFNQPIVEVASIAGRLQSGIASAERIFALLDADEQWPDPDLPVRPARVRGRVEFQRVSFGYSPDTPLMKDLSLTVEPGQTVAIVGPSGAGKSTLGNLLMRFYEVNGGRILMDGVDITWMTRKQLRTKIGMVLQDSWLFGGTIAENIAYGRADATREEIVAAARATCVDRFVRTLPDGYDTVFDDESTIVSAGEKQLITVARAFLAQAPILVLDEATSSVDTRTEVLIQRATNSLRAGKTSFVIAHRLSTIRHADLIVVMEGGRIVERGRHEELIRRSGRYAQLIAAGADLRPAQRKAQAPTAPAAPASPLGAVGTGLFRPLWHRIEPRAYTIGFRGVRVHVAQCGAMCVPQPPQSVSKRMACNQCFGDR